MLTRVAFFSAGVAIGLGVWWLSLDRRREKEVRALAYTHRLQVEVLYGAFVRALRYGAMEDFTFLVRQVHPQPESKYIDARRLQWNCQLKNDASDDKDEHEAP